MSPSYRTFGVVYSEWVAVCYTDSCQWRESFDREDEARAALASHGKEVHSQAWLDEMDALSKTPR